MTGPRAIDPYREERVGEVFVQRGSAIVTAACMPGGCDWQTAHAGFKEDEVLASAIAHVRETGHQVTVGSEVALVSPKAYAEVLVS
jgi:predicted small metal-binding protein